VCVCACLFTVHHLRVFECVRGSLVPLAVTVDSPQKQVMSVSQRAFGVSRARPAGPPHCLSPWSLCFSCTLISHSFRVLT